MACDTGMVRMQWGERYFYGVHDAMPSESLSQPGESRARRWRSTRVPRARSGQQAR
jgi:hypothetical protein